MTESQALSETDPRHHTARIKSMMKDVIEHAREDVARITDPKARALFETTAEVLQGLVHAYDHFEEKSEPAWR